MMNKMQVWNALHQPPPWALKQIAGGRLRGKTDVNPQWRYQAMTELFGPCGIGWKYEIVRVWLDPAPEGQVIVSAEVRVYVKDGDGWSDPIPGIGGSMLVEAEKGGLHANDEGYKMAVTDALSVALKMLGVAADVYMGLWDGSKYLDRGGNGERPQEQATTTAILSEPQAGQTILDEPETNPFGDGEVPAYPNVQLPPAGTKGINDARAVVGHAQTLGWSEEEFVEWYKDILRNRDFSQINAAQATLLLQRIKGKERKDESH